VTVDISIVVYTSFFITLVNF